MTWERGRDARAPREAVIAADRRPNGGRFHRQGAHRLNRLVFCVSNSYLPARSPCVSIAYVPGRTNFTSEVIDCHCDVDLVSPTSKEGDVFNALAVDRGVYGARR